MRLYAEKTRQGLHVRVSEKRDESRAGAESVFVTRHRRLSANQFCTNASRFCAVGRGEGTRWNRCAGLRAWCPVHVHTVPRGCRSLYARSTRRHAASVLGQYDLKKAEITWHPGKTLAPIDMDEQIVVPYASLSSGTRTYSPPAAAP